MATRARADGAPALEQREGSSTLGVDQLRGIGFDQRIRERLPMDAVFRDERGAEVKLGDSFGKRPVVLALVYADCPMLCSLVLSGLFGSLRAISGNVGDSFDVLVVSFDPNETPETARKRKEIYLRRYGRPGTEAGFRFLTGEASSIAALTSAVGFRYQRDAATGQYAHPAGIVVLGPDGMIARYLYGSEFSPRDLSLAVAEASEGRSSLTTELLLLCYRYDPKKGTYGATAMGAVRVGGVFTLVALGAFFASTILRDRRRAKSAKPSTKPGDGA
jgi:protein SCO1/2